MKNKCPFINQNAECTHKFNNHGFSKKLNSCTFNNESKCELYKEWLESQKRFRMANRTLSDDLKLKGVLLE